MPGFRRAGKTMTCPHCGGTDFDDREGLLNTRGLTFMKWDWANRGAVLYVCRACHNIQWFADA